MRVSRFHVWIFVLIFLVSLIMMMPLEFLLSKAGPARSTVSWSQVSGNVLGGRVADVRIGRQPVGNLQLRLNPLGVFLGRLTYKTTVEGAVMDLRAEASFGLGRFKLSGATGTVHLSELAVLDPNLRRANAALYVQDVSVSFSGQRCAEAFGAASSDMMTRMTAEFGFAASGLDGTLRCEADLLVLPLEGTLEGGDTVSVRLQGGGSEPVSLLAKVQTQDVLVGQFLSAQNFSEAESGYQLYTEF